MLYRAPVQEVKSGRISRRYGYLVVVMQYYPRFLPKTAIDEYVRALAPDRELFTEFKAKDRKLSDHDKAFAEVRYEERFRLTEEGEEELGRLSEMAKGRDVFLLCQCASLEHCHADLLLLAARYWFGAAIQHVRVSYPVFEARVKSRAPTPR